MSNLLHRRVITTAVAVAALLTTTLAATASSGAATTSAAAPASDGRATDQLIVKFRSGAVPDSAALDRVAGERVEVRQRSGNGTHTAKLRTRRSGSDVAALARQVATLPGVEYAEPDTILHPSAVPNDPRFGEQWDLSAPTVPAAGSTLVGANLLPAWDVTTGTSDVVVAVIDTGITAHADLAGQVLPGYDMITDTQIANDGSARDADPSDPGDWITSTENASGFFAGCGVSNSSWHGTHVAGTIAAASNNSVGVAGIAPGAKVLPVRVLGKCGGYTSDIVDGMRWAGGLAVTGAPTNPNPAAVLNLSLGGSGACSTTQQSAINDLTAVGTTVVVAAGNSNVDATNAQPGNCSGVITVAATGSTGSRAYYSNYGTLVELAAPGGDSKLTPGPILSTMNAGTTTPAGDTYVGYQGTSMATPHVAGVAALVKSVSPGLTPSSVLSTLQNSAAAFPAGSTCTTTTCGRGMLDASAAVTSAAAVGPRALGAFSKTSPAPGATGVAAATTLQWTGSAGANGYEYCLVAGLSTPCTTWTPVGTATAASVSGLSGSTLYSWQVRATNGTTTAEANVSLRSTFTTGVIVAPPGALAKTSPTTGSAGVSITPTLSWGASTGATSYEYCIDATINAACDASWISTGTTRSAALTGLAYSTKYEWQVRARNSAGTLDADAGTWWNLTTAAAPLPGAFAKTSPTSGTTGASITPTLSWGASTGATSYEYCIDRTINSACDGTWVSTGTARTATPTGLTSSTKYEWQVRARNTSGTTNANTTTWWTFTTAAAPGAFNKTSPANGATGQSLTPTLSWGASSGASRYEACIDTTNNGVCDGTWTSLGTSRSATGSNLTSRTTYYWQVRAVGNGGTTNANGGTWWSFTTA